MKGWNRAQGGVSVLYGIVRELNPQTVVELGTDAGNSAASIAKALRDNDEGGKLISVDNWCCNAARERKDATVAKQRLADNGLDAGLVEFVTSDSQAYLKACGDDSVDMVFVDADHRYHQALADTREALRVAKYLVVVHDTDQPEVRLALEQLGGLGRWASLGRDVWVSTPLKGEHYGNV